MNENEIIWDDEVTWDDQEQPNQPQQPSAQPSQQSLDPKKLAMLIGGGIVGNRLYQGFQQNILAPAAAENQLQNVQRLLPAANRENTLFDLMKMQKALELPTESTVTNIPKEIGFRQQQSRIDFASQERKIVSQAEVSLSNAKKAIEDFDQKILNVKVSDVAKTLEEYYPKFLKSASPGWRAGMDAIDEYLLSNNVKFNSLSVQTGLIDKAIAEGMSQGFSQAELAPFLNWKAQTTPGYDASGNLLPERPINYSEIKGAISGIVGKDPTSKTAVLANKTLLNFVDENIPQNVSPIVRDMTSKLNQNYRQFAEARFQYGKIMNKAGEFNTTNANKYLLNYFKSGIDAGEQKFVEFLSKGNDLVNGFSDIEQKVGEVTSLRMPRKQLTEQVQSVHRLKQEALGKLADDIDANAKKYIAMRRQYNNLKSLLDAQDEQIIAQEATKIGNTVRNLWKLGKVAGKVARGGLVALSIIPNITQSVGFAQDPMGTAASTSEGIPIETLRQLRDIYQRNKSGQANEEEIKRLIGAGLII